MTRTNTQIAREAIRRNTQPPVKLIQVSPGTWTGFADRILLNSHTKRSR